MKRQLLKAPVPFASWQAFWYDELKSGKPIEELIRRGYAVSDIRQLTRRYALKQGLPLLPAIAWIRKKGE